MAERCPRCGEKIGKNDIVVECCSCKKQYHKWCWGFVEKCTICGLENEDYRITKGKAEEGENRTTTEKSQTKEYISARATYVRENVNNQLNNEETGLFANIGEKIKAWAKRVFIIGVIFGIITFFGMFISDDNLFIPALGAGIGIALTSWTIALLLYAFGELVHNSTESKKIQQEILEELRKKKE